MKSFIIYIVFLGLFFCNNIHSVRAESGDTESNQIAAEVSSPYTESPLLIESISAPNDSHIIIKFNQSIIGESVRARITRQSNESNVRIESFTGGETSESIKIKLSDTLEANTPYKITIISAISETGVMIQDGADGLKEFTTPTDFTASLPVIELNAPDNPNAVIIQTESTPASTTPNTTPDLTGTESPIIPQVQIKPSEAPQELPHAGSDIIMLMIAAGILGGILILQKRKV